MAFKWISAFDLESRRIEKSSDTTIKANKRYELDKLAIVEKCSGLVERRFIQRAVALQLFAHLANEVFRYGEGCYSFWTCD